MKNAFYAVWQMHHNEFVDVFLAEQRKITELFGEVSDLRCMFLAGLPAQVKHLLRVSSRIDKLYIDQMLARGLTILKDNTVKPTAVVATATQTTRTRSSEISVDPRTDVMSSAFNRQYHLARYGLYHQTEDMVCETELRQQMSCFRATI